MAIKLLLPVLLACLVYQTEAGWLPRFICDSIQARFLRLGCLTTQTGQCSRIYNRAQRTLFGIPACNWVACNGYGSALGVCTTAGNCATPATAGICNVGQVCCANVGGGGGGGGGSSSDSSGSFVADTEGVMKPRSIGGAAEMSAADIEKWISLMDQMAGLQSVGGAAEGMTVANIDTWMNLMDQMAELGGGQGGEANAGSESNDSK